VSSALPQIRIETFDAYQLLHDIVADPAAFGLSNVTASCITPDEAPFICQDPDAFLFWDGTHPTVAAHGIVAQRAAEIIGQ
jgi:outer membrane lipase/esterase